MPSLSRKPDNSCSNTVRLYFGKHTPQEGDQYSIRLFYLERLLEEWVPGLHQKSSRQLNHLPIPAYAGWHIGRFLARVANLCCFFQTLNNIGT
ncbi:hypothetical protein M9X92_012071 [Pyricularia oryzae]|nr:hypothetical protein M9X92_012071 [Pyricularia oryzae]